MAFFEDLGKKLSGVGQSAVQKTQNATDSIRLNNQINEEKRKINAAYLNIGKRYVELHGSKMEPEFAAWIQEIEGCQQRINECRVQVRRNKGLTVCTKCLRSASFAGQRMLLQNSWQHSVLLKKKQSVRQKQNGRQCRLHRLVLGQNSRQQLPQPIVVPNVGIR